jgi:dihydrofolate reductase
MARTQYYCASTLDGYIAEADDTLDWLMKYEGSFSEPDVDPSEGPPYEHFYEGIGALVMGSATYEFILDEGGEWPYAGKPSWVLTSRVLPTPQGDGLDVRFANAAAADLHGEMAAAAGDGDLWVVGGGNVASQFADANLIDDLIVTIVPVVLAAGKPLFDRRPESGAMQLISTRTFGNGMVELRYEIRR